jgi:MFS family permease
MMVYNLIEAIAPAPMGKLADRMDRSHLFLYGVVVLSAAHLFLMCLPFKGVIWMGVVLAGLHMGMTQGLIGTMIAGSTLPHLRGSAFSIFYCVAGAGAALGNFFAGHFSELSHSLGFGVRGAFAWGLLTSSFSAFVIWRSLCARQNSSKPL